MSPTNDAALLKQLRPQHGAKNSSLTLKNVSFKPYDLRR